MVAPAVNSLLPQQFFWDNSAPAGKIWAGVPTSVAPAGLQLVLDISSGTGGGGAYLPMAGGSMTGPLYYTATGGTVARSAQDRAADVANVADFGGSIQAAHDSLPSTGGTILLSANTVYDVTAQITFTKPNVRISAPSLGTILRRNPSFTTGSMLWAQGANSVIEGFTVDANAVVESKFEVAVSGPNALVRDMQIINGAGTGHLNLSGQGSRAIGNRIAGLGISLSTQRGYGIYACSHATVLIEGNTITGTGIDGIGFDGEGSRVIGNYLAGCHCWNSTQGGQIATYYTPLGGVGNALCIVGNTIGPPGSLTQGSGIEAWNPGTVIAGNTFDGIQGAAITVFGNGTAITGNSMRNCGGTADAIVVLGGVTDFVISGNRIADEQTTPTMRFGVSIYTGASDRYTITGNLITGNTGKAVNDLGTGLNKTVANNQGNADASLARAGGAMSGGLGFGSSFAASNTDVTRHVALYGANNGFGVVSGRINYIASAGVAHSFVVNAADVGAFGSTGLNGCALGATTPAPAVVTTLGASGLATFFNGIGFNANAGASGSDITKGVQFQTGYGIGWTSGRMNVVAGGSGATYFVSGTTDVASIWSDGLHLVKGFGVFGSTIPAVKPSVSGSRGGNAALASLLTALASYGLCVDGSTA